MGDRAYPFGHRWGKWVEKTNRVDREGWDIDRQRKGVECIVGVVDVVAVDDKHHNQNSDVVVHERV